MSIMQSTNKRVLVTGATGFIGRHLCDHLLDCGFFVRALVRKGSSNLIKPAMNLEQFVGDLLDAEILEQACKDMDIIVHLAALAHVSSSTQEQLQKINVQGTKLLLAAAHKHKVQRFIFMSSVLAAKTDAQECPATAYGRAKLTAENWLCHSLIRGI